MKRDMDLIRKIMLQIENDKNACKIEGYEDDVVLKHLELLEEADLLKASFTRVEQAGIIRARVERLTWDGHEFLDAARSDTLWNKAKEVIRDKAGSAPFAILQGLLLQLVKSSLGLP